MTNLFNTEVVLVTGAGAVTLDVEEVVAGVEVEELKVPIPKAPHSTKNTRIQSAPPQQNLHSGCRLTKYYHNWEKITQDPWVLSVIRKGYKLELETMPALSSHPIPFNMPKNPEKRKVMIQEVCKMLEKGAIEIVDPSLTPGFYSPIFLTPKKDGTMRPIINLKKLNQHIRYEPFKMESERTIFQALNPSEWVIIMDLQDAYFHISIHRKYKRLLRFVIGETVYQYKVLPFGLASAPKVFTRITRAIGLYLHQKAIISHMYLDDWLFRNTIQLQLYSQSQQIIQLVDSLGFIINRKKSILTPTQRFTSVGVCYMLDKNLAYPPEGRLLKIEKLVNLLLCLKFTTARFLKSVIGVIGSAADYVPLGRLYLRPLHQYLYSHWSGTQDLDCIVPLYHNTLDPHLKWWTNRENTNVGVKIKIDKPQHTIYADASKMGWGAHMGSTTMSGTWSESEKTLHINALELLAIRNALLQTQTQITNKTVLIRTDNTTAAQYLKNQGGTRSTFLNHLAKQILLWTHKNNISILVSHIAGKKNVFADLLSRRDKILQTEWSLLPSVTREIFLRWQTPQIDMFASEHNHKLPIYVSPVPDHKAWTTDAMTLTWQNLYLYAFPPIPLLPKVLDKFMSDKPCQMILIAPKWPKQSWYPLVLQHLVETPLELPLWKNLLKQPRRTIFHQQPQILHLHAWKLSNCISETQGFLNKLQNTYPNHADNHPDQCMTASGQNSIVGVRNNILIRSTQLFHI